MDENILEQDDEDEDNFGRKTSQDFSKKNPLYDRTRNSILKIINLDEGNMVNNDNNKKFDTTIEKGLLF